MRRLKFILSLVLILSLPLISRAEIKEGSFEVNPFAGVHFFEHELGKRGVYGMRLGYNLTQRCGIEAAYDQVSSRASMLHADALYHFMPEKTFNPFVVIGAGGANIKPGYKSDYNTLMGNAGVGFKYFVADNIAIRTDARYVLTNMHNFVTTAGLTFALGGKAKKAAVAEVKPEPVQAQKAQPKAEPVVESRPEPKPEPAAARPAAEPETQRAQKKAAPVVVVLEDIHFDFDKAALTKAAQKILRENARTIKDNHGMRVQIEGHACAHGTEEYNMALSERRANAVKEFLVKEGTSPDRLTTISYGETRLAMPEEPTPKNKNSKEARENRRVHFEVIAR